MTKKPAAPTIRQTKKVPWQIVFFQRHRSDDPHRTVPGREFLQNCPEIVRAKMVAVLKSICDAPPPAFSGGGYWEKMHAPMSGYYEVRVYGPQREHFRLFCILEHDDIVKKLGAPSLVIITGAAKSFRTTLTAQQYAAVRHLGDEYLKRCPRSVER